MLDHHVPVKTTACRRLLSDHSGPITRARRSLLIMVDGRRSVAELRPAMAALQLGMGDLQALTEAGLLHWLNRAADAPPQRPAGNRSVAGAKLYALDLLGRMLARDDVLLREAARAVTVEADLLPWLRLCEHVLTERCHAQRAALFIDKVCTLLPEEWATALRAGDPSELDAERLARQSR
ncbi:hypothetical protein [Sphaerotilus mobilis]|uniref:hypothetical protein n=1 Tax=Sphaerotilus mobilis TaxID=47994 RepID=UPI00102C0F9F|nr:hypothetical protein [Sphaerotilus mobilis]